VTAVLVSMLITLARWQHMNLNSPTQYTVFLQQLLVAYLSKSFNK